MALVDFQSALLPMLQQLADGQEQAHRGIIERLAKYFHLSEAERSKLLPSGNPVFDNRIGWAATYLKKAGLIESTRRGFYHITPRGREVLKAPPNRIDGRYLKQFEEFAQFRSFRRKKDSEEPEAVVVAQETPDELLENAYQNLRENLASELLQSTRKCSPAFFERLVVDLLVKMGYGGSRREAGEAIGKTGDGGIDGIIKEDKLGLDIIYIQAKRWEGSVGRPEVQKFAGALQGQRARKGILITTSAFTRDAIDFAERIDTKIILIDGERLAELMIDHQVGVSTQAIYELKRIDSDYFSEE